MGYLREERRALITVVITVLVSSGFDGLLALGWLASCLHDCLYGFPLPPVYCTGLDWTIRYRVMSQGCCIVSYAQVVPYLFLSLPVYYLLSYLGSL